MTKSARERRQDARYSVERRVAPHVDPEWAEAVLLELRMRDVPGDRIGAALAEVDAHVVDSGEDARTAFGDPVEYARNLDLRPDAAVGPGETARVVGGVAVQLLGMSAVLTAVGDLARDRAATVTVGHLVSAVVVLLALVTFARWVDVVLATAVRRPLLTWVVITVGGVLSAVPSVVLDDVALRLAPWPVLGLGAAVLVGATVFEVRVTRPSQTDPVVGPLDDAAEGEAAARSVARWAVLSAMWVPAATVVLAGTAWLLAR